MSEPDRPRITPAAWFLAAAVLGLPVVAAAVAFAAPRLASMQYRSMPVLAVTHLVTLGWGTMVAMGSLNQLLPAAAGVRWLPGRSVRAQFPLYSFGVAVLVAGFLADVNALMVAGSGAVVASVAVFLASASGVLRRRTRWLPALDFVVAALACLLSVTVWGLLFVLNWRYQFWKFLLTPGGLNVHLVLGLVGWFALLIVGVSYYLLPRFAGAPVSVRTNTVLWGFVCGIALVLTGAFVSRPVLRAGYVLIAIAGGAYTVDLLRMLRAWRPKSKDITRVHWLVLAVETALLSFGLAAGALGILPGEMRRWAVAGVSLFLLGWVTLAITGQAYKVTPFLMWHYRFGRGLLPLEVPRLEAPYWPAEAFTTLLLMGGGAILISLGVLLASQTVSASGGVAFLAGACIFAYLLGYSWEPRLWARAASKV